MIEGTWNKKDFEDYKIQTTEERLPKPNESNRDWPEDYDQENGNYQSKCCLCGLLFYGNKHRVICRKCEKEHDFKDKLERLTNTALMAFGVAFIVEWILRGIFWLVNKGIIY